MRFENSSPEVSMVGLLCASLTDEVSFSKLSHMPTF